MRRTIGKTITNPNNFHITHVTKHTPFFLHSSSPFSSGSGGGRGRGGGGGGIGSVTFDFGKTPGKPNSDESKPESTESKPSGLGHGRGKPIATDPILPSFSSFVSNIKQSQPGPGRGRVTTESQPGQPGTDSRPDLAPPKKPIFVKLQELKIATGSETQSTESRESNLPPGILSALSGAGRGKPTKQPGPTPQITEENRHVRARGRPRAGAVEGAGPVPGPDKPKLSREEAVKNAVRILSSRGDGEEGEGSGGGRGGGRGRGRGRGRGGRGMWRERGGRGGRGRGKDSEEGFAAGLYLGDNADGEKLAKRLGVENMNKLVEGFEEMSGNVLPSPMEDVYLDAMDVNFAVRVFRVLSKSCLKMNIDS